MCLALGVTAQNGRRLQNQQANVSQCLASKNKTHIIRFIRRSTNTINFSLACSSPEHRIKGRMEDHNSIKSVSTSRRSTKSTDPWRMHLLRSSLSSVDFLCTYHRSRILPESPLPPFQTRLDVHAANTAETCPR